MMAFIGKSLEKHKFLKKKKQVKNKCFVKNLISIPQAISQTRGYDPAFGVDPPKPRVMTRGSDSVYRFFSMSFNVTRKNQ